VFGSMARRPMGDGGWGPGLFADGGVPTPFIAELSSDLSVPMSAPRFFAATPEAVPVAAAPDPDGSLHVGWQFSGQLQPLLEAPLDAGTRVTKTGMAPYDLLYGRLRP